MAAPAWLRTPREGHLGGLRLKRAGTVDDRERPTKRQSRASLRESARMPPRPFRGGGDAVAHRWAVLDPAASAAIVEQIRADDSVLSARAARETAKARLSAASPAPRAPRGASEASRMAARTALREGRPSRPLADLVTLLARGQAPQHLAPFLAGASLTALAKEGDDVRPIAVGEPLRR